MSTTFTFESNINLIFPISPVLLLTTARKPDMVSPERKLSSLPALAS
jgi:hypothetical protein